MASLCGVWEPGTPAGKPGLLRQQANRVLGTGFTGTLEAWGRICPPRCRDLEGPGSLGCPTSFCFWFQGEPCSSGDTGQGLTWLSLLQDKPSSQFKGVLPGPEMTAGQGRENSAQGAAARGRPATRSRRKWAAERGFSCPTLLLPGCAGGGRGVPKLSGCL